MRYLLVLLIVVAGCGGGGTDTTTHTVITNNGPKGDRGDAGSSGTDGSNGTSGAQGSSGSVGPQGAQGLAGANGISTVSIMDVHLDASNHGPVVDPACPSGWTALQPVKREYYTGGSFNKAIQCYNETQTCTILVFHTIDPSTVDGFPENCPMGWTDHWNSWVFVGYPGSGSNLERLCYKCQ